MSKGAVPRTDPLYGLSTLAYPSKRRIVLTPLNKATTKQWQACEANGGHLPGSRSIMRTPRKGHDDVQMRLCATCGVPISPGARVWSMKGAA